MFRRGSGPEIARLAAPEGGSGGNGGGGGGGGGEVGGNVLGKIRGKFALGFGGGGSVAVKEVAAAGVTLEAQAGIGVGLGAAGGGIDPSADKTASAVLAATVEDATPVPLVTVETAAQPISTEPGTPKPNTPEPGTPEPNPGEDGARATNVTVESVAPTPEPIFNFQSSGWERGGRRQARSLMGEVEVGVVEEGGTPNSGAERQWEGGAEGPQTPAPNSALDLERVGEESRQIWGLEGGGAVDELEGGGAEDGGEPVQNSWAVAAEVVDALFSGETEAESDSGEGGTGADRAETGSGGEVGAGGPLGGWKGGDVTGKGVVPADVWGRERARLPAPKSDPCVTRARAAAPKYNSWYEPDAREPVSAPAQSGPARSVTGPPGLQFTRTLAQSAATGANPWEGVRVPADACSSVANPWEVAADAVKDAGKPAKPVQLVPTEDPFAVPLRLSAAAAAAAATAANDGIASNATRGHYYCRKK
ncbi:hypothetical protein T492DRAFT_847930 [Pavlovales sp. CCMP2436]|nr:hypothetical protein T492DRAFT_847930 [Pavlovales sp. CCMP2436]